MLGFPAEDPDTVDVAELQGDYPREVLRDYERAFEDHLNGNAARAVERLESIAVRAPGFYGAHARLGLIFQQEGCLSDAETEYHLASQLSGRSVQPLLNLASVQIRAADIPGNREKMISRALETLQRAQETRPSSALAYCLAGAARVKIRAFEEAEADFRRALDLDPTLGAARLLLADLYLRQQNWDAGIENLRAYLDDFPFAPDRSVVKQMIEDARRHAGAR
jgi:tetratricopeptide (TPR) repeat protein